MQPSKANIPTCVEEGAEGEGAVLLVEREVEDVKVADAGHPHGHVILYPAFTADIGPEAWRGLMYIRAARHRGT